jgi:hypothetical protein
MLQLKKISKSVKTLNQISDSGMIDLKCYYHVGKQVLCFYNQMSFCFCFYSKQPITLFKCQEMINVLLIMFTSSI